MPEVLNRMQRRMAINELIPAAESYARQMVAKDGKKSELRPCFGAPSRNGKRCIEMVRWDFFTEYFHREMNRMTREAGIRNI